MLTVLRLENKWAYPYFCYPLNALNSANRAIDFRTKKGAHKMNAELVNNELVSDIEELEAKIAPESSATFLD